jgi:hypothetical protein
MTNKFRFWAPMAFGWALDLCYELTIKFYIKSSPKTLKLVNISLESEKGAKNSNGSYPTEFFFEVKNENLPKLDQLLQ